MYKSNKLYHFLFKYLFLLVALIILLVGVIGYLAPHLVSFNKNDISVSQANNLIIISIIPLVLFLAIQRKFVSVTTDNYHLKIENSNKIYNWNEVIIDQVPFIFPPLYILRFKKKKGWRLFNTDNKFIWISVGFVKDLSSMGELIKKKRGLDK